MLAFSFIQTFHVWPLCVVFSSRLWDIECGACLRVLEGHEELVRCIRFDNKRIVSGAYDGCERPLFFLTSCICFSLNHLLAFSRMMFCYNQFGLYLVALTDPCKLLFCFSQGEKSALSGSNDIDVHFVYYCNEYFLLKSFVLGL